MHTQRVVDWVNLVNSTKELKNAVVQLQGWEVILHTPTVPRVIVGGTEVSGEALASYSLNPIPLHSN